MEKHITLHRTNGGVNHMGRLKWSFPDEFHLECAISCMACERRSCMRKRLKDYRIRLGYWKVQHVYCIEEACSGWVEKECKCCAK